MEPRHELATAAATLRRHPPQQLVAAVLHLVRLDVCTAAAPRTGLALDTGLDLSGRGHAEGAFRGAARSLLDEAGDVASPLRVLVLAAIVGGRIARPLEDRPRDESHHADDGQAEHDAHYAAA